MAADSSTHLFGILALVSQPAQCCGLGGTGITMSISCGATQQDWRLREYQSAPRPGGGGCRRRPAQRSASAPRRCRPGPPAAAPPAAASPVRSATVSLCRQPVQWQLGVAHHVPIAAGGGVIPQLRKLTSQHAAMSRQRRAGQDLYAWLHGRRAAVFPKDSMNCVDISCCSSTTTHLVGKLDGAQQQRSRILHRLRHHIHRLQHLR